MKNILKYIVCLIVAITCITNLGVNNRVDAATINSKNITLSVGEVYKINSKKGTKWSSSMPGVASVKNGNVTALNVGKTVITAKNGKGSLKYGISVKQDTSKKYKKQEYVVGNSIKKGYYVLYSSSDTSKASYVIYNGTEKITNNIVSMDEFGYNKIVYLDDGQLLYMENCYAKKMKQSIVRTSGSGNFKVGTHIKAGKYKIVSKGDQDNIMCTISKDWNSDIVIDNIVLSKGATQDIKISNGQYITLVGCELLNK
jgi:hypothetical protein